MPRGGARVNSGPPPDPNALRRDRKDDKSGWTTLPAVADVGVPDWPLPPPLLPRADDVEPEEHDDVVADHIAREDELWAYLWSKPQAVMWARLRCADEVAIYVRLRVLGERDGNVKLLAEARMRGDRLGVEPASMARLRWRIATDELGAARQERATTAAAKPASMRDRIRAVNGGR